MYLKCERFVSSTCRRIWLHHAAHEYSWNLTNQKLELSSLHIMLSNIQKTQLPEEVLEGCSPSMDSVARIHRLQNLLLVLLLMQIALSLLCEHYRLVCGVIWTTMLNLRRLTEAFWMRWDERQYSRLTKEKRPEILWGENLLDLTSLLNCNSFEDSNLHLSEAWSTHSCLLRCCNSASLLTFDSSILSKIRSELRTQNSELELQLQLTPWTKGVFIRHLFGALPKSRKNVKLCKKYWIVE